MKPRRLVREGLIILNLPRLVLLDGLDKHTEHLSARRGTLKLDTSLELFLLPDKEANETWVLRVVSHHSSSLYRTYKAYLNSYVFSLSTASPSTTNVRINYMSGRSLTRFVDVSKRSCNFNSLLSIHDSLVVLNT